MQVTIVDRKHMAATYGTPAFRGVCLRTVDISDKCPACGGARGEPRKTRYHEWGEFYYVDNWTNPCGHIDKYSAVLNESNVQYRKPAKPDAFQGPDSSQRHAIESP